MPKFAMYYIPPAESALYRLGTEMLGYDIRAGALLPAANATRGHFPGFDPAWVTEAQQYGFHVTTAGTYEYDPAQVHMESVIQAVAEVFDWFDAATPMTLSQHPGDFIWMRHFVALHYDANPAFQTLHTVLCTLLPVFGQQSRSMRRLQENPQFHGSAHHLAHRTQRFFTPYIFDGFAPHFTLMNPFTGADAAGTHATLANLFAPFKTVEVASMCLVRLRDDASHYEIVHEFHRADYPRAFAE